MNEEIRVNEPTTDHSSRITHHSSLCALLVEVRWQVFRNSLRTKRNRFELAAKILVGLLTAAIVLGVGLKLGDEVHTFLVKERAGMVPGLLLVFVVWQLAPLLIEASSPALHFREIARYPVSFRQYYLLHTAYGLLDPAALVCLVWLACIWAGIVFARPAWTVRAGLLLAAFALLNLLLNRAIFGFVEQVMSTRRGRERLGAFLLALMVLSQFVIFLLPGAGKERIRSAGRALAPIQRALPYGLVSRAVQGVGWSETVPPVLAFAAYGGVAALLLRRQLWRNYRGEVLSETPPVRGAVMVQPGWKLPLLDDASSTMVEKELRYALRDPRTLLSFLAAPLAAVIVVVGSEIIQDIFEGLNDRSSSLYPALAGYALLSLGTLGYNCFCYDARGFDRWLMAPIDLRRVFLAKNVALGALLAANFAVVTLLLGAGPGLSVTTIVMTAAGVLYASLTVVGAGNLVSVWYPMGIVYGELEARKVSSVAVLVSLLCQMAVAGSLWLVFHVAGRWDLDWLPLVAFLVLILAALKFYLFSLSTASKYAWNHSEQIVVELA